MTLKKNDPLRLDVSYLVKEAPGTRKEFDFDFTQLSLPDDLLLVDIHGVIAISVTEDGVMADGKWLGEISTEIMGAVVVTPDSSAGGVTEIVVVKDLPKVIDTTKYQLENTEQTYDSTTFSG